MQNDRLRGRENSCGTSIQRGWSLTTTTCRTTGRCCRIQGASSYPIIRFVICCRVGSTHFQNDRNKQVVHHHPSTHLSPWRRRQQQQQQTQTPAVTRTRRKKDSAKLPLAAANMSPFRMELDPAMRRRRLAHERHDQPPSQPWRHHEWLPPSLLNLVA